jgi:HK97 family phage major capsid protein
MEIQDFVTRTAIVPINELTTLAATRACFGDDVLTAFRTQVEIRQAAAQGVLDAATAANRDTLLASEQRMYDTHLRERDAILSLQQAVERRTEQRVFVPVTQTHPENGHNCAQIGPVLGSEQRVLSWLEQRGGAAYQGESGSDRLRFGSVIRAFLTGNRTGLSELERRVLAEGSDPHGGYVVPEVLGSRIIDRAREQLVVQRAGAQIVPMTSDTLHLARLVPPGLIEAGGGSPTLPAAPSGWKLENAPIQEADLELERLTFHSHTLALLLKMSVELSEDGTNIDSIIENAFASAFAEELDRVALVGSGVDPEPRGVKFQPGVQTDTMVSPVDWDWLIDAAGLLWTENHDPTGVIAGTAMAISLAKLRGSDDQPLTKPGALDGVRFFRSSAAGSDVFVADWSQLLIGMRTSFRLESSRVAGDAFTNLQVWVRAYLRADIQLAHPEAFVVLTGGAMAAGASRSRGKSTGSKSDPVTR